MKKYLITGVSSGIGRVLAKNLILKGNKVWGIARRKELLQELNNELRKYGGNFHYSAADVSQKKDWGRLMVELKRKKFFPDSVVFNAAVFRPDLGKNIDIELLQETFSINFFGVIQGIESLLKYVKKKTQFLAISSLSGLKGSSVEGIGYPASKSALSIAFESLHLKYKDIYIFKTLFLGPVVGGVSHFKNPSLFVASEKKAAHKIEKCLEENDVVFYYPYLFFFILKVLKLFPPKFYFSFISKIEKFGQKISTGNR